MLGRAVFNQRLPKSGHRKDGFEMAATIERQTVDREYVLDGEDCPESVLSVIYYGAGPGIVGTRVTRLAELVRVALTRFRGTWHYYEGQCRVPLAVENCYLAGEGDLPASVGVKTPERWAYRYQQRWRILHDDEPLLGDPAAVESIPPPPPEGIGSDVIGSTIIR